MKLFHKVLISIGALILLFLLFIAGYKFYISYRPIPGPGYEPPIIVFKSDFESVVNGMASDFGSIRKSIFQINSDFDEVCFESKKVILNKKEQEKYSFDVEKMKVEDDFCIEPIDRKITLRIEGKGDSSEVSIWK